MNKQELIKRIKDLPFSYIWNEPYLNKEVVLEMIKHLDEPETGHADEAPRYFKNILARLRELPLHDREVWLKAIMGEFEQDFSHAKWREGYYQGKFEGMLGYERDKVKVPSFVADHIEHAKEIGRDLQDAMNSSSIHEEVDEWLYTDNNMELFARAWLDGYEVDKEPKYTVKFKATNQYLCDDDGIGLHISPTFRSNFRKSDLEKLSLTEVFDSPLFEVEEV